MRRIANLSLVLFIACLVVAPAADAKWIAFERGVAEAAPGLRAAGTADHFSVAVKIPGVEVVEQDGYTHVRFPNAPLRMIKDEPELPMVTMSILLPDQGQPEVKLVDVEETVIDVTSKVAPSRGHLTRDVDLSTVPLVEGAVYGKDALYPAADYLVDLGDPYICRDVRGAAIRVCPVKYNPVTGKLHVLTAGRLEIGMGRAKTRNTISRTKVSIDADFAPIYKKLFINFDMASKNWTDIDETQGRAIILCPDEWLDNLAPLQEWRAQKGLESKIVPVSQITNGEAALTGEMIKAYIQGEYDAGNLTWILLVGDADKMPPLRGVFERAHSDAMLVKLAGDDNIPDAFISRFSCQTAEQLDVQVARVLKYEKEPVTGDAAAFYRKATGIASNEGNPKDWERANWLRDIELAWRYDVVDQIYDPSANAQKVMDVVNEGRGLMNYIGHGSKTMWVSSRFNVGHVNEAANTDGKWPMIWSVACVNGDFAYGSDCFGEAWAKAGSADSPRGAIGIVCASTNMAWVPPCVWQKAIVEDYLVTELAFTGGAQHHYGCLKACEEYGYHDKSQGVQIIEQCIYFGDATVMPRNDIPQQATVSVETATDRGLTLKVLAGDKPVKAARVVVSTELHGGMVGTTDENGIVKLEAANGLAGVEAASVTVTGPNLIPVIDEALELPAE